MNTPQEPLRKKKKSIFDKFAAVVTRYSGHPAAFFSACAVVILWAATGPIFNFSDTWQLVINTGTTIITFLMVFVIQQSQNKDTIALHLKLNELIAATKTASNRLVDVEDLSEKELQVLKQFYIGIADMAETEDDIFTTHSVDEAKQNHHSKHRIHKKETKEINNE